MPRMEVPWIEEHPFLGFSAELPMAADRGSNQRRCMIAACSYKHVLDLQIEDTTVHANPSPWYHGCRGLETNLCSE
ncbi:hypothetical protein ACHAXM_000584 [Skeletonema potamos]